MPEAIYAKKNSVVFILNGHAFERAIGAYFLNHMVLTKLILQGANLNVDVGKKVVSFLEDHTKLDQTPAIELMNDIHDQFVALSDSSLTSALWLQYWKQITIIKYYIRAERSGDFDLRLYCIKSMFTIRRINKFWSGTWSDMVIE